MNSKSTLMAEGPIYKQIIKFAFPILCENIFQQLYNTVDSLVIGNFVGKESLAAISSTSSLIFLLVGLFTGIFSGAGVVISRYFGTAVAGCGSYSRIEGFAFIPITSFALSMTTFIDHQSMKEQKRYLFWYSYLYYSS